MFFKNYPKQILLFLINVLFLSHYSTLTKTLIQPDLIPYRTAITEISTLTSLGNRATCTVSLAGGSVLKYSP